MSAATRQGGRLLGNARGGGIVLWAAVVMGPAMWTVHLTAESALARFTCTDRRWELALHLTTAATAVATLAGMAVCAALVRGAGEPEGDGSLEGQHKFMGLFGGLVGGISLALILLEGAYVFFIDPCI